MAYTDEPSKRRSLHRWWTAASVTAAVIILGGFGGYLRLAATLPPPPAPLEDSLPSPNARDETLAAFNLLPDIRPSAPPGIYRKPLPDRLTPSLLRRLATKDSPALIALEKALTHEWRNPAVRTYDTAFPEIAQYRALCQIVLARGRFAEQKGRLDEAAHDYLLGYRLGVALAHGGNLIHGVYGIRLREQALDRMAGLVPKLSIPQAEAFAKRLSAAAGMVPPLEETLRVDRDSELTCLHDILSRNPVSIGIALGLAGLDDWQWHWHYRLTPKSAFYASYREYLDARNRYFQQPYAKRGPIPTRPDHFLTQLLPNEPDLLGPFEWERCEAHTRLVRDSCALKQKLDRRNGGALLATMRSIDPFSGKPFLLHRDAKATYLYSLGPDLDDDDGRPAPWDSEPGDGTPDGDLIGPEAGS